MKQEEPKPNNKWKNPGNETPPNNEDMTELTEDDLNQVSGGTEAVVHPGPKQKAASKNLSQDDIDRYIRG